MQFYTVNTDYHESILENGHDNYVYIFTVCKVFYIYYI
jgi:hypothetical protein